uniref:HIG1 domain family member 1A n=1 Tax=Hemiscolopendra marginata TaxID=943146 RepID=A0A646QJB1_9MYRI
MATQRSRAIIDADLPVFQEESSSTRFWRKAKEAPYVPAGLAGGILSVLYGIYKYRHRGDMSTSIFLIHLRVAAQGAVVSALTVGVGYTLLRDYVFHHPEPALENKEK